MTNDKITQTNSHDSNTQAKSKGPLRLEAIVPIFVLSALIALYFSFAFDSHLKKVLEYGATTVNGAEVNISSLKTSFLNANLEIREVEVTDPARASHNIISIGSIRFEMSWDALLRAKVLINEASIKGIRVGSKRTRPGRILPPPPPEAQSASASEAQKFATFAVDQTQQANEGNALGKIAAMAKGEKPEDQLKKIEADLQAEKKLKQLEQRFKDLQLEWDRRLKSLPDKQRVAELENNLKGIQTKDFKTPQELEKSLAQFNNVLKEADGMAKELSEADRQLKADLKELETQVNSIDQWIKDDIELAKKRLSLPDIQAGSMSKDLFMQYIGSHIEPYKGYIDRILPYLPTPQKSNSSEDKLSIVESSQKKRSGGRDFHFAKIGGYPAFWLKLASISSSSKNSEISMDLAGSIENLSSDQAISGNPMTLRIEGGLPSKEISGIDYQLRHSTVKEPQGVQIVGKVEKFKLNPIQLLNSPDLSIKLIPEYASLETKIAIVGFQLDFMNRINFNAIQFETSGKEKEVQNLFSNALSGIGSTDLTASIRGPLLKAHWDIQSALGRQLADNLRRAVNERIEAFKREVELFVNKKIEEEKAKVLIAQKKLESDIKVQVEGVQKQLKAEVEKVNSMSTAAKKDAENKAKNEAVKAIDNAIGADKRRDLEEQLKKGKAPDLNKLKKGLGL